jgi:RHS repeat-associated protein
MLEQSGDPDWSKAERHGQMPGRQFSQEEYRYGFQGQETDKEWLGSAVSYKYRVHDARIGRFLSVDPLASKYPYNSQYAFSENSPIAYIELEGAETEVSGAGVPTPTSMRLSSQVSGFQAFDITLMGTNQSMTAGVANYGRDYKFLSFDLGFTAASMSSMNGEFLRPGASYGNIYARFGIGTEKMKLSYTQTKNRYKNSQFAGEYDNTIGQIRLDFPLPRLTRAFVIWGNDSDILTRRVNYEDGGFTNYIAFGITHEKLPNWQLTFRSDMFTPDRIGGPNGDGTGDYGEGKNGFLTKNGSIWNSQINKIYVTNNFSGNFSAPFTATLSVLNKDSMYQLIVGVNNHDWGSQIQAFAHRFVDVPEFDWNRETPNSLIFGVSISKNLFPK